MAMCVIAPVQLRIGTTKHGYVYDQVAPRVYRCARAAAGFGARAEDVLWLFYDEDTTMRVAGHADSYLTPADAKEQCTAVFQNSVAIIHLRNL